LIAEIVTAHVGLTTGSVPINQFVSNWTLLKG
jgi:hypothetical protein